MAQPTVLLVDADGESRGAYAILLEFRGFHVLEAGREDEARRLLEEVRPDVLVVEPLTFGRRRWVALATLIARAGAPTLVVSALALPEDRARGLLAGCVAYRTKPHLPRDVAADVARLVHSSAGRCGSRPAPAGLASWRPALRYPSRLRLDDLPASQNDPPSPST